MHDNECQAQLVWITKNNAIVLAVSVMDGKYIAVACLLF